MMKFIIALSAMIIAIPTVASATWTEKVTVACMGDKTKSVHVECNRSGERLEPLHITGCWPDITFQHTCGEAPVPIEVPPVELPKVEEPCASPESGGFFVGGGYRYISVPGSAEFHGGIALAGYRHFFEDKFFLEIDGGAGGGVHSILVQDEETDKAAALATLGVHFGVRPNEHLSISLGPEGFVTGNGTETLMGGIMGTLRLSLQLGSVRLGGFVGVGMSYHSDPYTRDTWNGQPVEDLSTLSEYDRANVVTDHGSESGLDFGWTAGANLVFDLP